MTHTPDIQRTGSPPRRSAARDRHGHDLRRAAESWHPQCRHHRAAPLTQGKMSAGPALTLQFMPMREDQFGAAEYDDPEKQLHRHVLYHAPRATWLSSTREATWTAESSAR